MKSSNNTSTTRCRYQVVRCCEDRGIKTCGECSEYPCDNIKECFAVTKSFEPMCRQACTDDEYKRLEKAFFEKEKNLSDKMVKLDPVQKDENRQTVLQDKFEEDREVNK